MWETLRAGGAMGARRFHKLKRAAVPLVLLALLPLVANWPAVSGWLQHDPLYASSGLAQNIVPGPLLGFTAQDPNDGFTTEALGHLAAEQWLHGRVPWWNPYGGIGLPLAAEMLCSALFLPFVLLLHFAQGALLLKLAMQMIAGFATYELLRALGLGRLAAFTGGALYELNGTFAWFGDASMLPIAFLPLLLLGLEGAAQAARGGRRGGWVWVPVALALSLYAGFPETAYIDGLLALAWAAARLWELPGAARMALARKIAGGGVAGLLLAAPAVLPFLQLLQVGHLGEVRDFGGVGVPAYGLAALLSPYVFGVQGTATLFEPANRFFWFDAVLGGYLSLVLLPLALLGAAGCGRERRIRRVLLGWCVLALGRAAGVPGITQLVNAVPLLGETMVFRYAAPSWEMAVILLAAFALDDWQRRAVSKRAVLTAAGVAFVAGAAAVVAARPFIASLLQRAPQVVWWLWGSLAWTGVLTAATALMLLGAAGRERRLALAAVLTLDAVVLFTIPVLSAPRRAELDMGVPRFLAANLGAYRFHALGPLHPNYAAYFGLASVDADYLPAPRRWVRHVGEALDPFAVDFLTLGSASYSPLAGATLTPAAVLRTHLAGYEEVGVRYIVTFHGTDPFAESVASNAEGSGNEAHPLWAGQELAGVFPPGRVKAGRIAKFGVLVGTYAGAANGEIKVELCAGAACAEGTADLAGAADNAVLDVALDAPLDVGAGAVLGYRIVHADGREAVALWIRREPGALPGAAGVPHVVLTYAGGAPRPARVYADDLVDIYELAGAKPYFEARGGACTLSDAGREKLTADCRTPATLVRRELAFPGWHATINGEEVPVGEAPPLLQAIQLPQGVSRVRFRYWPPYIGWAYCGFLLGLGGMARALVR